MYESPRHTEVSYIETIHIEGKLVGIYIDPDTREYRADYGGYHWYAYSLSQLYRNISDTFSNVTIPENNNELLRFEVFAADTETPIGAVSAQDYLDAIEQAKTIYGNNIYILDNTI